MPRKTHLIVLLVALALVASTATASAWQGEAPQAALDNSFTYQGYLTNSSGTPVHDSCDFAFSLYDAATAGTQIGTADNKDNVQVEHGQFTVRLNDASEFGGQPFNGDERYLQISVSCPTIGQSLLSPRQPLRAAPYAIYALNVPAHDHAKETWTSATTGSGGAVLTLDNTGTLGNGLIANGTATGYAVLAEGAFKSTADSHLYISPHSLVERGDNSCLTLSPEDNGSMKLTMNAGCTSYVSAPVSAFGTLFGTQVYVKSVEICYKDTNNNYIDTLAVMKNDGAEGDDLYLSDTTDRGENSHTCYTVNAATPRQDIDNSTWVQFNMHNMNPMGSGYDFYIYTIKLTLSEERE